MTGSLSSRFALFALTGALAAVAAPAVRAATPDDTLIVVDSQSPNILDINGVGANDAVPLVAANCYDRLVTWDYTTSATGVESFDSSKIVPQLAAKWEIAPDGKSITFHLHPDAVFHSGNPVTAEDVRWTLDRVVSSDSWTKVLLAAGGMTKPEQFVVVDEHTLRVDFESPRRMALAALGGPAVGIVDSKLAQENTSEADPWARDYLNRNCAGSGPYKVSAFEPAEQIEFERFEDRKAGPVAAMERVIYRRIEADATRRSLIESGDVDVALGLKPKDIADLQNDAAIDIHGTPAVSSTYSIDMDTQSAPFSERKVREAIAHAIPSEEIVRTAFHGRGVALTGGKAGGPYPADYPVPYPYDYDLDKARALLKEAGYGDGFSTKLFFNQDYANFAEPMALLAQDSLRQIGVQVEIVNIPGATYFEELGKHHMPMVIKNFASWLNYPEYYFLWNFHGGEYSIHNSSNYKNPELDKLIDAAYAEPDTAKYKELVSKMVQTVVEDVPRVPVTPVFYDVATRKNVHGFVYWFHLQLELAKFSKTAAQ